VLPHKNVETITKATNLPAQHLSLKVILAVCFSYVHITAEVFPEHSAMPKSQQNHADDA